MKLRPLVPDEIPRGVRRSPGFGVEVDAMPGGFVCPGAKTALEFFAGELAAASPGR